jgi:hypothetical protein
MSGNTYKIKIETNGGKDSFSQDEKLRCDYN